MKRWLRSCAVFALALIVAAGGALLLGAPAKAATFGDYAYTENSDGTCTVTGYSGNEAVLVIPDAMDAYTVAAIGDGAFKSNQTLTSVTLPNGVTSVGSGAFDGCAAIRYAAIGSDAAKALSAAGYDFRDPGMPKLALKYSADLLSLTLTAADGDIETAVVPEGVTAIGQGAFSG
ncbi:MAG: leucine-rich repeat protein, partial [Clostridia bacterium]|nr:leucine-rich repeat protein [Clostridia bacterium]